MVSKRVTDLRDPFRPCGFMQDKSKLGTRFTCYQCGVKFYDLNKPEPSCPGCGANQLEDPTPDPRVAVMERYKGSRLTAKDAAPSKEAFNVDEPDMTEDGVGDEEFEMGDDAPPEPEPEPEPEP